jgi:hypothetical protein
VSFSRMLAPAILIALLFCAKQDNVAVASTMPIFDLTTLKGIDTVVVVRSVAPEHTLLPEHVPTANETKEPPGLFLPLIKELFAKQPWITVKSAQGLSSTDISRSNVLLLDYAVTAQQEQLNGSAVTIASLALQIRRFDNEGRPTAIPLLPVTYPFVVPQTEDAFYLRLGSGVRYLTSYIPGYISCANKYGHPSNTCPDCNTRACDIEHPFKSTIRPVCPPPVEGQTIPVPCGTEK